MRHTIDPADEEAERLLIGTLLAEGKPAWDDVRAVANRSGDELINLIQLRPLWDAIRKRGLAGAGFDLAMLNSEPDGQAAIEAAGGLAVAAAIGGVSPVNLPDLRDRLIVKADARARLKILSDAAEFIHTDPDKSATIAGYFTRSMSRVGECRSGFPPPVKLADWLAKPMPQRPEVIRGLLRRGDKMTLGGSSKSKKTWFAAHLALCVSAGLPWMGFPTVKCPVTFVNLELPEDAFHGRLKTLCDELNFPMASADFRAWNLRGHRASVERIDEALQADDAPMGLIVLDPLYKLLGDRVENAAEDVADLLGHLEAIATRHNCALVVPAHYSKGNQSEKESIDRIGGSGVFARDADAIVTMTAHETPDCFSVESVLRSFAPIDPFVVRWEFPLFHVANDLDPSELKKSPGAKAKYSREDFVGLLGSKGLTLPELRDAAQERMGMSRPKAYAMFKELLGNRIVLKPGSPNSTVYIAKE